MRLIDADAKILTQVFDEEHEEWTRKEMTVEEYLSYSDTEIPFVDAVQVVRCRDCVYWERIECSEYGACYRAMDIRPHEKVYCAFGERKDGTDHDKI